MARKTLTGQGRGSDQTTRQNLHSLGPDVAGALCAGDSGAAPNHLSL